MLRVREHQIPVGGAADTRAWQADQEGHGHECRVGGDALRVEQLEGEVRDLEALLAVERDEKLRISAAYQGLRESRCRAGLVVCCCGGAPKCKRGHHGFYVECASCGRFTDSHEQDVAALAEWAQKMVDEARAQCCALLPRAVALWNALEGVVEGGGACRQDIGARGENDSKAVAG